jgi:hypothetical protein
MSAAPAEEKARNGKRHIHRQSIKYSTALFFHVSVLAGTAYVYRNVPSYFLLVTVTVTILLVLVSSSLKRSVRSKFKRWGRVGGSKMKELVVVLRVLYHMM